MSLNSDLFIILTILPPNFCSVSLCLLTKQIDLNILSFLKVNLNMEGGRSLGLMIRGGAEYGLGIYITGVDPGSAADIGGLKVPCLICPS